MTLIVHEYSLVDETCQVLALPRLVQHAEPAFSSCLWSGDALGLVEAAAAYLGKQQQDAAVL